ncbi:hypothetical protein EDB85DRAFT_2196320, partial [Lactarius pseudohatsudake]
CDPVDSSSAKSRRARAPLCPGKVASTIAHITLSGGGDGQSTSRSRYSPRQVTFSSHQITKIIMPFGGRLAYFAWPLGLLCLHLARLLPGDFSQPSPTAFARAPERPGRPSLPVVTALGHRSSLAVARDCHARLPPLFSSPPPTPPRTGLLAAAANPHHTPPAISPGRGPKPKMRHLCKNAQIRARLVEDSGDLDTIEGAYPNNLVCSNSLSQPFSCASRRLVLVPTPPIARVGLGLLCLHLARLLPVDSVFSHRVRPSAARRALLAGAPPQVQQTQLDSETVAPGGHHACSSLIARGRSGLPRSLDIDMGFPPPRAGLLDSVLPPLVAILLSLPPSLQNLSELLSEETKRADIDIKFITVPLLVASGAGLCSPKMRHLCKNAHSRRLPPSSLVRLVEDSGDDSRRLPPSSLVRLVEDSGDLDTIEGAYKSLLKMYPNDIDSGIRANLAMEGVEA